MSNLQILGERIKHYRKLKGLTQKKLADQLGVAHRYISHIEQGHRGPSLDMQVKLCKNLGVSMSDLLPMGSSCASDTKEVLIGEIADSLRAWETPRVESLKTLVCSNLYAGG